MDKIEMSLDDIIKSNKQSKFKGRGAKVGGGGGFRKNANISPKKKQFGSPGIIKGRGRGGITRSKYTRGDVNSAWKHDMFEGGRKGGATNFGSAKLVVSNLDFSVSDSDINELFQEFGPLKAASVHYDRSGRSLGTADVIFERRTDALKAMKTYNGVPLDGRPMSILIATAEVQPSTAVRIAKKISNNIRGSPRKSGPGPRRFASGGSQRGGGGGGNRGRGPNRGGKKPEVTVDELNAELDAYTMQG